MYFLICLTQDTLNCMKKGPKLTRRIDVEKGEVKKIPKNKIKKKPKKQKEQAIHIIFLRRHLPKIKSACYLTCPPFVSIISIYRVDLNL